MEQATDIITPEQAGTLYGLLCERVKRSPHHPAYRSYSANNKIWSDITWQQVADQVSRWQQALAKEGLEPGERVAINLKNCVEWVFFDQAAMSLGLVTVPLYPDDRPDNVAYILEDADVKLVLLQNEGQWKRLEPSLTEKHQLQKVIIVKPAAHSKSTTVQNLESWLVKQPEPLLDVNFKPDELASIVYSSGTTGRPKGVMLSHYNMLSVAFGALKSFEVLADDLFLSFLPLSHTLERTAGYYLPVMSGSTVAYARSIAQLSDDIQTVKPSILIAVPRIFERIYSRIHTQLSSRSFLSKALFKLTTAVGWTRFQYLQSHLRWRPTMLLWPLLDKLVAAKVRQRFGGNIRLLVSGGAALPQTVSQLFISLDLCLLQGYGLTETSPIISVNIPNDNDPSSVGIAIHGVEVMIGDNDELLARSPGKMIGYWNNHKATAQTINADGWLHTGDQARIGQNGHIYITGRIKDILILSNGEKIPPSDIESAILMDNTFEQALIVGEGQPYLTALLVLNPDHWFSLAQKYKLDAFDNHNLEDKSLQSDIIQRLRQLLHEFPAYARIRRVTLTLDAWTVENDLMTPTMKIKRAKVIAHHQHDIDNMYS